MTIARRGSTNYSAQLLDTANSFTITKEPSVQSGDLLFIAVSSYADGPGAGNNTVANFIKLYEVAYSGSTANIFYRVINGTEESNFTISIGGNIGWYAGAVLVAFSGSSLSIEDNNYTDNGSGTSPSAPSVTAASTNTLLVNFYLYSDPATFTAPSGSDGSFANSPQQTNSAAVSWDAISASGATGTRTATLGVARDCVGVSLLLKETAAASTSLPIRALNFYHLIVR